MTFSITARCAATGQLGVAISTAIPAVGALCCFGAARVAVVASQAWVNPYLGIDTVARLPTEPDPELVLRGLVAADPRRSIRQVGVVTCDGSTATHTGSDCVPWAGHLTGPGYSIQGNMLTGPETLAAMERAFVGSEGTNLAERLLRALADGQAAGGDKRGRQSAALRVYDTEDYPALDLRVDDHHDPVAELARIRSVAEAQLEPFVETLPTRADPAGRFDEDALAQVLHTGHEARP